MSREFHVIPGLTNITVEPHQKALVAVAEHELGTETIIFNLVLPVNAPTDAVPLCGSVYLKTGENSSRRLWNFQGENYRGRAHLMEHAGEAMIAFVGRNISSTRMLERLLPLRTLLYGVTFDIETMAAAKSAIARELKVDYRFTSVERDVVAEAKARQAAAARAKREAEQQAEEAKRRAEREEREARRQTLQTRRVLTVVDQTGRRLRGLPVVGDEWERLPGGTRCVSVEHYDDGSGRFEGVIDHFMVDKKGGKPRRQMVVAVSLLPPRTKEEEESAAEERQPTRPQPIGDAIFKIEGRHYQIPVYRGEDGPLLRKLGPEQPSERWALRDKNGNYHVGVIEQDDGRLFRLAATFVRIVEEEPQTV